MRVSTKSVQVRKEDGTFTSLIVAKGEDGLSPSAKVERIEGGAKITITDKRGTTEAIVNDGRIVPLTQIEYDNLSPKDENTLYIIVG